MHKDDASIQRAMGYKPGGITPIGIAAAKTFLLTLDPAISKQMREAEEPYRFLVDLGREQTLHNIKDGTAEYLRLVDTIEMLIHADY
jgi:hypothetical protein